MSKFRHKYMLEMQLVAIQALELFGLVTPRSGKIENEGKWDEAVESKTMLFALKFKEGPTNAHQDYRQLDLLRAEVVDTVDRASHERFHAEMRGCRWSFCSGIVVLGMVKGRMTRLSVTQIERCRLSEDVLCRLLEMRVSIEEALEDLRGCIEVGRGRDPYS